MNKVKYNAANNNAKTELSIPLLHLQPRLPLTQLFLWLNILLILGSIYSLPKLHDSIIDNSYFVLGFTSL